MKTHFPKTICILLFTAFWSAALAQESLKRDLLPQGFVSVSEVIPAFF